MKTCTICKITKNKDQFPKHGGHRDGDVFVQQARFVAVVRQKTGNKPEVDEFDE